MQEEEKEIQTFYYIIEHLESTFSQWCMYEYMQIVDSLNNKYSKSLDSHKGEVLLMNIPDWKNKQYQLEEQKKETQENWKKFIKFNEENGVVFKMTSISLFQYIVKRKQGKEIEVKDYVIERLNELKLEQICFMDMRAELELRNQDKNTIRAYIFGGILGDDPPQDRASHLRNQFDSNVRKLGVEQMTTDTAINVTKMIIQDSTELESMSFVNHPDLPTGEGVEFKKTGVNKGVFDCAIADQDGEFTSLNFKFLVDKKGAPFSYKGKQVKNYPLIHPGIHKILCSEM